MNTPSFRARILRIVAGLAASCIPLAIAPTAAADTAATQDNPFAPFFGDWTLKEDKFAQVWDGKTVQNVLIPNHFTHCAPINTQRSVLCVVDAGDLKGHILWTFDSARKEVHHLSHFGTTRNGVGVGALDEHGNLKSRVSFQDEPAGSYRIYEYTWVSKDEYTMMSRQYSSDGKATGNWYGGTFVRRATEKRP